jgi:hypothetical protein
MGTTVLLPVDLKNATVLLPEGTTVLRFDVPAQTVIA